MAVKQEFEALDRAWLKKCVQFQRDALVRSRAKELDGSEIYVLRTKEIQYLDNLAVRLDVV